MCNKYVARSAYSGRVFLTDNVPYIVEVQAGHTWDPEPVVLRVDVTGLKVEPWDDKGHGLRPHEFVTWDRVAPGRILECVPVEWFGDNNPLDKIAERL